MLIKSEFDIAGPPDKVWNFFNDIPLVASCLPGADISEQVGDDEYTGTVVIRVGPVKLDFTGEAMVKERDDAARRIVVEASGADVKGRGQAVLLVDAVVTASASGSRVQVDQNLHLAGIIAQYGRGLVQDVTAVLLDHFAANMRQQLAALESGAQVDANVGASVSHTKIALHALRLSMIRVFKRFFFPYQPTSN